MGRREGRAPANDLIAASLAAGQTREEAAAAAGVSRRTVYRRMQDASFQARVRELRDEMVTRAAGQLASAMALAADVLRSLLLSQSETVRLRAADLLLGHGIRVVELSELQARIEALEARAVGGLTR